MSMLFGYSWHAACSRDNYPTECMWQVLLLRLRQACVHPFLSQTKAEGGSGGSSSAGKEEAKPEALGEPRAQM